MYAIVLRQQYIKKFITELKAANSSVLMSDICVEHFVVSISVFLKWL